MRAAHSLLHGHVAEAFGYNCLMVLTLPLIGAMSWNWVTEESGAAWPPLSRGLRWVIPKLPWIIGAYWILRNLPFYPFSLLAPNSSR
jgi:hypothetical protein